jgi:hypothetical protein
MKQIGKLVLREHIKVTKEKMKEDIFSSQYDRARASPTRNPTKTMDSSQDRVTIDNSAHKEHNKFTFNGL